jgi:hypothetical protein
MDPDGITVAPLATARPLLNVEDAFTVNVSEDASPTTVLPFTDSSSVTRNLLDTVVVWQE